jgi:hypothetical protein
MAHSLMYFKYYLQKHDYNHLIEFIENHRNNMPNEKKIIILMSNDKDVKNLIFNGINAYLKNNLLMVDEKYTIINNINKNIINQNIIIAFTPNVYYSILGDNILNNAFIINTGYKLSHHNTLLPITHPLDNWKPYLNKHDFNHLIEFIENNKNNIPNQKKIIILMGKQRTGKTSLLNDIYKYSNNIWLFDGFHTNLNNIIKKYKNQHIIISYLSNIYYNLLGKTILDNAFIINMTHKF